MRVAVGILGLALSSCMSCPALAWQQSSHSYYRSTDGSLVHLANKGSAIYGRVTATCGDGSHSYSHHHQATCSHHGGVAEWGPGGASR